VETQIYIEPLWKMRRSYQELIANPPPGYRFVIAPSFFESAAAIASRSSLAYHAHWAMMKLAPVQLLKPALEIIRRPPRGTALTWAILHINFRREPWVLDMSLEQPHLLAGSERMFDRWRGVIRRVLRSRYCRAVVCELEIGRRALLERLGAPELAEKAFVVRAAPPSRRGVAPVRSAGRRILFVNSGNIDAAEHFYTHGGALLAPVFHEVRRRHQNVTLVVRSRLPAADRKELEETGNVEIYERMLSPDGLDALFRSSDVFLYPTHVTPSAVLLDAMSYGLPIVTTNVWGNGEFLVDGESGLLVHHPRQSMFTTGAIVHFDSPSYATAIRARDEPLVRDLADAVVRLLEDQALRARLHAGALDRVTSGPFSTIAREQQLVNALGRALDSPARRSPGGESLSQAQQTRTRDSSRTLPGGSDGFADL
jgi:glycosyltransferase involved in cell wall biosynthesis